VRGATNKQTFKVQQQMLMVQQQHSMGQEQHFGVEGGNARKEGMGRMHVRILF
jgi:hypothetical protein